MGGTQSSSAGGFLQGEDRLTCPAQPGHGGKRSDSPERGITSAVTKLTQAIDHNRNNLIEN